MGDRTKVALPVRSAEPCRLALSAWESVPFDQIRLLTGSATRPRVTLRHPRSWRLMARLWPDGVGIWELFNDLDVLELGNVHHHRPALPWTPEEREHRVRFDNR
jgi:hypothetical protein